MIFSISIEHIPLLSSLILKAKEMHEAATHQLKVELKHGKKETKVLLEEAQQEYDSQFSYHFNTSISQFSKILFTCPVFLDFV